jgi:NEDD4-binding protein 2
LASDESDCVQACDDTKNVNEVDGFVILDEVLSTESDDGELNARETAQFQPKLQQPAVSLPTVSYASMTQKPASENAARATNENGTRPRPPYILYQGYTSYDRLKRTRDSIERVKWYVRNSFKIMVILRGCPGSGKSMLAETIIKECCINNNPFMHIHSTDNYFCLDGRGQYRCEIDRLTEAHHWNQVNVLNVVRQGLTPVIVDNTNTQLWEMEMYASMAVSNGYEIEVIEPDTHWAFSLDQLAAKNTHGVQEDVLRTMLDRYEHNVIAETLLKNFCLTYSPGQLPPQRGVRNLSDPALVNVFERIYQAVNVDPETREQNVTPTSNTYEKREKDNVP